MVDVCSQLRDGSLPQRIEAARLLARDAAAAARCAAELVRAAGSEEESLREWATAALEDAGPPAPAQLDALAALLADGNDDCVYWAATLLGRAAAAAGEYRNALENAAEQHAAPAVRKRARWAVQQIVPG